MQKLILLIVILINSACTTSLYVARTDLPYKGKNCEVYTYWYTTSHPFVDKTGKTYPVLMGKHASVTFVKKVEGIIYKGVSGADNLVGSTAPDNAEFICGEFVGVKDIRDLDGNKLKISMKCKKISTVLTHRDKKNYLPYIKTAHELTVTKEKEEFFWFGGLPKPPKLPVCHP